MMRIIGIIFIVFFTQNILAQIGVNTLTPKVDFDVNGTVRLRKLLDSSDLNRYVVANAEGNLATYDNDKNAYQMTDVYFITMKQIVETTKGYAQPYNLINPSLDLGLEIEVIIEPKSSAIVSMEYNIPLVIDMQPAGRLPWYVGLTLMKKSDDMNFNLVEIAEGSRKFTVYDVNFMQGSPKLISMPIVGVANDIIENHSAERKKVYYIVKGYIEGGNGTTYFGGYNNDLGINQNFGRGVFTINIYEKRL